MNVAIIFAGGSGLRMHTQSRPKQFLELMGKPIIIYTLEHFDHHPEVDAIVVACKEEWIAFLEKQLRKFDITKVVRIVPGGETGQDSIYHGLCAAEELAKGEETTVLIHDGVRPLITEQTISDNLLTVRQHGSCITCVAATESLVVRQEDGSLHIPSRDRSLIARAPQSFRLTDILAAHRRALAEGRHDFIDSCTMMSYYGFSLATVMGPVENIKITTPTDFFLFRAMVQAREDQQIFGL